MSQVIGVRILYTSSHVVVQDLSSVARDEQGRLVDRYSLGSRAGLRSSGLLVPFGGGAIQEVRDVDAIVQDRGVGGEPCGLGLLGIVTLASGPNLVLVTAVTPAARIPEGAVYSVHKVQLIPLYRGQPKAQDQALGAELVKIWESGHLYFSPDLDLSQSAQSRMAGNTNGQTSFWWNQPIANGLPSDWMLKSIYGFVGHSKMTTQEGTTFLFSLISRRSFRRAGTRYITRGVDVLGNVANFVETEQLLWNESASTSHYASFSVIRGSIPVFWRQNNGLAKPPPELVPPLEISRNAFVRHFQDLRRTYGEIVAVSLVNKTGPESDLADAYSRHIDLDFGEEPAVSLVAFDFHHHCQGSEYEQGLARLMKDLEDSMQRHGVFYIQSGTVIQEQQGVFRVNCVDCLDRTNVVESVLGRVAISLSLQRILRKSGPFKLSSDSDDVFKRIWADNGDAISRQYSGTGALKSDFTRTGQRSTTGILGDGVKSVMRMYYKNIVDQGRQECIEVLCGYATGAPLPGDQQDVVFSYHDAQRVGAGGDRDPCTLEVRQETMMLSTAEGLRFDFPREGIVYWERRDDVKDRPRLRFLYAPESVGSQLVAASPLEFQFKRGFGEREKFLRSFLMWCRPKSLLLRQTPVRIRLLGCAETPPESIGGYGLTDISSNDVVCVFCLQESQSSRKWGLGAVPCDFASSGLSLVHTRSVKGGVAMALFMSAQLATFVGSVDDAEFVLGEDRGVAIGIRFAVGDSLYCVVVCNLSVADALYDAVSSLRLGRAGFDVSCQFDHLYIAGRLGSSSQARDWTELSDGSSVRSLSTGLSCIRYSLTGLSARNLTSGVSDPMLLVDEVVDAKPGPDLSLADCRQLEVHIARLQAERLRMPRGVPRDAPLLGYLSFQCSHSLEVVTTRSSSRMSQTPVWDDKVTLPMVATPLSELSAAYIFGQVLITTPMAEDISIGSFAISLGKIGADGRFSAMVRSGGLHSGLIQGTLHVNDRAVDEREAVLGVTSASEDIRNKVSNTRKAKKFLGKVSNYLTSRTVDSPFALSSGPDPVVAESSLGSAYHGSTVVDPRSDSISAGSSDHSGIQRPRSPDLLDGPPRPPPSNSRASESLFDMNSLSSAVPPSSTPSRTIPPRTIDDNLLLAFGFDQDSNSMGPSTSTLGSNRKDRGSSTSSNTSGVNRKGTGGSSNLIDF
mmetsp:Transcript_5565/g.11207  ORF Transcript_5565/g.11207 Transcript_5565/m.11207 type:complete len:1186 (-) Transcript_5565:121-3678(-)